MQTKVFGAFACGMNIYLFNLRSTLSKNIYKDRGHHQVELATNIQLLSFPGIPSLMSGTYDVIVGIGECFGLLFQLLL